ncbi:hypothetical protein Pfo_010263 [Paulownia fortunei]|nr:hypothetical protein Pfo_010263 [Paulownia fortunei]
MLLLEMVGGRKNVDLKVNTSQVYFPQWIYNHLDLGEDFWAHIEEGDDGNIARRLTIVGLFMDVYPVVSNGSSIHESSSSNVGRRWRQSHNASKFVSSYKCNKFCYRNT